MAPIAPAGKSARARGTQRHSTRQLTCDAWRGEDPAFAGCDPERPVRSRPDVGREYQAVSSTSRATQGFALLPVQRPAVMQPSDSPEVAGSRRSQAQASAGETSARVSTSRQG